MADDTHATHGNEGGDIGVLIATVEGWVCPHCDYRQDWAHALMAEPSDPSLPEVTWLFTNRKPTMDMLNSLLSNYQGLADQDKHGASVMVSCLKHSKDRLFK